MKKNKGCLQDDCIALKKKIVYRMDDIFCSKCGKSLYIVCKRCRKTVIEEKAESALCMRCQAEVEDKKQKRKDNAKKAVDTTMGVVAGVGAVAGMAAKMTIKKK